MPTTTADCAKARPTSERHDLARLDERHFDVIATFVAAIAMIALIVAFARPWPFVEIAARIILSTR
jgi:hypothetical protein